MIKNTMQTKHIITIFIICFFVNTSITFAQTSEQKAMKKLSFMVGDWKGSGTSYPKETSKPYDVMSTVHYDLDGELIVLRHRSKRGGKTVLALHTLIYYNKEDGYYYYNAFRKNGARPFKCKVNDGKLICEINGNYRLTFQRTQKGKFNEFGQRLVNGKWVKNFEDILHPATGVKF
ncbi:MAG: hypothetical protein JXR05_07830 [Flavobacteriaceae bacterium]